MLFKLIFSFTIIFSINVFSNELFLIDSAEKKTYKFNNNKFAFEKTFLNDPNDRRNIIIYVHGRGKNPNKSLKWWALPKVSKKTNTRILMFHWNSWNGTFGRPYDQAVENSISLGGFLADLDEFMYMNPLVKKRKRITLLFHSMGNILFKNFIENYYEPFGFQWDFFDSIILHSPDVPSRNHHLWLDKVDFTDKLYVIQNRLDLVLLASEAVFCEESNTQGCSKLGVKNSSQNVAQNTQYLDLTNLAFFGHRAFNMPPFLGNKRLDLLISTLLNGERVKAEKLKGVNRVYGNPDK